METVSKFKKVGGKQVQPLCDDRECLRKDTDFIRASLFTSSRIVKNLNQHIVKSPDKQRLKKLCARRSNIWANL